jgi:nitronate monooxygenase
MKALKIGKHTIEKPIIQGGMGVGISWDKLAGSVSQRGWTWCYICSWNRIL